MPTLTVELNHIDGVLTPEQVTIGPVNPFYEVTLRQRPQE